MGKRVVFNGIEINASEGEQSTRGLLGFVENVITRLESGLDKSDENFNMCINTSFSPTRSTRYNISIRGIKNERTRDKVVGILQKSAATNKSRVSGTLKVDLQVQDG
ncbi:MAG: hypothetical protein IT310_14485 [Anaerolineales bacterium]|nr:hypothetical protein [Anaerolineales bacterium]